MRSSRDSEIMLHMVKKKKTNNLEIVFVSISGGRR